MEHARVSVDSTWNCVTRTGDKRRTWQQYYVRKQRILVAFE